MKPKVYIETSVISYLTSRPSRDVLVFSRQQVTQDWWNNRRHHFELLASERVISEASGGDEHEAQRRLDSLRDTAIVPVTAEAITLAQSLIDAAAIPPKAAEDALHIALAVVAGADYLITWNCKHIANAALQAKIEQVCRARGYEPTRICTPDQLLEEQEDA